MRILAIVALAGAALATGCATPQRFAADVTRFHLNQPLARGAVFLEGVPGAPASMEDGFWRAAVGDALRGAGFALAPSREAAELVGVVAVRRGSRTGPARSSPVSIGVGVGGGGSNIGGGVGVGIPLGKPSSREIVATQLELRLSRASDGTTVWEGRATSEAPGSDALAQPANLAPRLAGALLADFPGVSGQTVRYPRGRR